MTHSVRPETFYSHLTLSSVRHRRQDFSSRTWQPSWIQTWQGDTESKTRNRVLETNRVDWETVVIDEKTYDPWGTTGHLLKKFFMWTWVWLSTLVTYIIFPNERMFESNLISLNYVRTTRCFRMYTCFKKRENYKLE